MNGTRKIMLKLMLNINTMMYKSNRLVQNLGYYNIYFLICVSVHLLS